MHRSEVDVRDVRCSTPFGIKGWSTSALAAHCCRSRDVLNAFRHQRMVHVAERARVDVAVSVLNAFRHQRMVHVSSSVADASQLLGCSTPFGIKGWSTAAG